MEYLPSFRDDLHADSQPSFMHSFRDEHDAKMMYGLPKVKKFPMPDAAHVRSAIRFFNYAKPSQEQELASAILARMNDYSIDPDNINVGDNNRFKKYLQHSYLAHHGIKGMHWGVRRYQNEDGSLTPRGQKRYNKNKQYLDQALAREDQRIKYNKDFLDKYSKKTERIKNEGYDYLHKKGFDDDAINSAIEINQAHRKRYQDMGRDFLNKQIDVRKKISDIDPSTQSYRKTKKLVKNIIKDSIAYERNAYREYLNSPETVQYRKARFGY